MTSEMDALWRQPQNAGADAVTSAIRSLASAPDYRVCAVGHSAGRRPVLAIEFGSMKDPALIVGGTHAAEWATVLVALRLAAEVADSLRLGYAIHGLELNILLRRRGAIILPLLNPDGLEIQRGTDLPKPRRRTAEHPCATWQANARGVDLNHNFNAGFYQARRAVRAGGILGPGPTRHGGLVPFSQPETRAIRRLCAKTRPRALYALHSQGEEIYWKYGNTIPEGSLYIGNLLASLTGYRLCEPGLLAGHAGMKDWFIQKYRRPGFTLELGLGENPLPYEALPDIWTQVERALFVSLAV